MSSPPFDPVRTRPRLADHVMARRHVVSGVVVVALHDERTGRVATLGEREWILLCMADGTRDVDGIASAAARVGRHARRDHLVTFLDQLAQAEMLADGPSLHAPSTETASEPSRAAASPLGVVAMPGFSLRCDGRGTCCRLYPTTLFSPIEARAAQHHDGDVGAERERFTPERGSEQLPWRGRAVTMVDGRCAYLERDGRCRLHARAGAHAKPLGCRQYPVQLVRDGRALRVAVAPECACVFDSAHGGHGTDPVPLLEPWPRQDGDIGAATFVAELSDEVALSERVATTRDRFVAWCDAAAARFEAFEGDPARWLWAQAEQLEGDGAAWASSSPTTVSAPDEERVEAARQRLVERHERRAAFASWRNPSDLAAALPRWLAAALDVSTNDLTAPQHATSDERFFVRALLFGHDPALSAPTVVDALRRRALQIWTARRLARVLAEDDVAREDPAARWPLALVAAYGRGFGI